MPNILDIRRRIRSVTNTRQITKAMKMVSAAKLRRAQDRALAARPYAQMLTNVLKSLVSRAEIYDPETGEPKHPLLAQRPEKHVLLIVVTGDKGLAGAFNANILKAAARFLETKAGKNIEIEAIGRKGRDFLRRRYPARGPVEEIGLTSTQDMQHPEIEHSVQEVRSREPGTYIVGERIGVLNKLEYAMAAELAERVIERYSQRQIDSVYLLYNEFKSVISQRLIVEQVLPIEQIGVAEVRQAEAMSEKERERALEAAKGAGVGIRPADTRAIDAEAARFAAAPVDYIYEQPASWRTVQFAVAQIRGHTGVSCSAGIGGGGARGAHDGHGRGHEQRHRHDRLADVGYEPGAPGEDYKGDYRNCEWGSRTVKRQHPALSIQPRNDLVGGWQCSFGTEC